MEIRATVITLFGICLLSACAVKDEVEDGLWEIRAKVARAELTATADGGASVDFTFMYLLGLVDEAGIAGVEWSYVLVAPDGEGNAEELGREDQIMRQEQPEAREVFVQGERPRVLVIDDLAIDPDETYVLRIYVYYRESTLTEVLIPLQIGQVYLDEEPYGDIPQLSTR
jgi:hypothetical protein